MKPWDRNRSAWHACLLGVGNGLCEVLVEEGQCVGPISVRIGRVDLAHKYVQRWSLGPDLVCVTRLSRGAALSIVILHSNRPTS